jgi:hypothetical protein
MKLKDILSISGEGGLFKFIAQGKNSIIVEHLDTKKRSAAHGTAKVSSLEDISIFTDSEDIPLGVVFDKISEKEDGGAAIDHKVSVNELKTYFDEVLPDYDRDRVYVSDIKKLIAWYNTLQGLDMLIPGSDDEEKEKEDKKAEDKKKEEKTESKTPVNKEKLTKE